MKKLDPYIDDFVFFFIGYLFIKLVFIGDELNLGTFLEVTLASGLFAWFYNWANKPKK